MSRVRSLQRLCKNTHESFFSNGEEDVFSDFADAIPLKGFIVEMIYSLEEPSNASVMIEIFGVLTLPFYYYYKHSKRITEAAAWRLFQSHKRPPFAPLKTPAERFLTAIFITVRYESQSDAFTVCGLPLVLSVSNCVATQTSHVLPQKSSRREATRRERMTPATAVKVRKKKNKAEVSNSFFTV